MKKIIKQLQALLLMMVSLITTSTAYAWSDAQWIWTDDTSSVNQWVGFRKQLSLAEAPSSATLKIAVDSKYWLWVNGQLVVYEGGLKRGPTPLDTWYDEVDLSQYLKSGNNTLSILAWYWGKEGYSHKSSGAGGMVANLSIAGTNTFEVNSDHTWKVKRLAEYVNSASGTQPDIRLPEYNVVYDARLAVGDWFSESFDDQNWSLASTHGAVGSAPWNQLVRREIPQWKDYGLKNYANVPQLPLVSTGQTIEVDLPYNAHITPYFKVRGSEGQVVHMEMDAYRDGGAPNVRAEYITKAGQQAYESLGWMSGHTVKYRFPVGIEVLELKYRETGYDAEFVGQFSSNDAFYNKLWTKAGRTLYVNMRDTFFDCPTRERAQWWGDVVNQLGEVFYTLDPKSHQLIKKGIYDLTNFQKGNDVMFAPVPTGIPSYQYRDMELSNQILASVGEYGFWKYYFNTGDRATIEHAYPAVKRYLELWSMRGDGLVNYRAGDYNWGDWGGNVDTYTLQVTWYYMALDGARKMAQLLGRTLDLSWYEARMSSIDNNFDAVLWKGDFYKSTNVAYPDDRANAMAVISGLADSSKHADIGQVLKTRFYASPFMEKYVLEALFLLGEDTFALNRMKSRYNNMVASEYSTLWEGWAQNSGATYNHAWNAPNTVLSQYAVGVSPSSVGWATYSVLPQMGKLTSIHQVVPSVKGNIDISLDKEDWGFGISLNSPANTVAKVGIPLGYFTQLNTVEVNGAEVYSNGNFSGGVSGVEFAGRNSQFVMFNLQPGSWTIEGRGEVVPVHIPDWTHCANENETCSFDGKTNVRYGAGNQYTELEATNQVQCDNDTFGDPASGLVKSCEYDAAALVPVTTWTHCADENGTCTFTGTRKVRYGANGLFAEQTATGSIACNNSVFGDPISGVVKSCEVEELPQAQWTQCATEGQTCNVPALSEVRYGANETYSAVQQVSSSVGCSNTVFGDPIYGVAKSCEYRLLP
ncbi:alpha-L-rhamnosidase C-terminal domain-containing protein [Endozoicomonas sp. OPT23]|uniref:alpha-L-rhamnosidase-related protein n=1 Tax=Endozoicomonas sp. OPT23 TaxID=2072845 RepID=UPI00189129F1|nr:alpha-L-rhamnosidase C-terminal domain-containing protein [Endozoicomonas sp. OPT23]